VSTDRFDAFSNLYSCEVALGLFDGALYIYSIAFSIDSLHEGDLVADFSYSNATGNFKAEIWLLEGLILALA